MTLACSSGTSLSALIARSEITARMKSLGGSVGLVGRARAGPFMTASHRLISLSPRRCSSAASCPRCSSCAGIIRCSRGTIRPGSVSGRSYRRSRSTHRSSPRTAEEAGRARFVVNPRIRERWGHGKPLADECSWPPRPKAMDGSDRMRILSPWNREVECRS